MPGPRGSPIAEGCIEQTMPFDAFISYSSKDKTAADAACATLESAGVRCWIAPRDIRPGGEYGAAIIEAIDQCHVMVLIFSSSANDSRQIHREIERAVSKGVTIVPLRIDEVVPTKSMEYFLGAIHWLDALTPPIEKHLQLLAETVKAILKVDRDASADDGLHKASLLNTGRDTDRSAPRSGTARMSAAAPLSIAENSRRKSWLWPALGGALCVALLVAGVWLYQNRVGIHTVASIPAAPVPAAPIPAGPIPAPPTPASPIPTAPSPAAPAPAAPIPAAPSPPAPQPAPKQAEAVGNWVGNWAGVWFVPAGKRSTVTIALKGNSIAGTTLWRDTDDSDAVKHRADGTLFNCKLNGSAANCELEWDYTDPKKDLKNHATGSLTLDGDHLSAEFRQDEAEPTWRLSPSPTSMHVGAVWHWDLVRRN
jgi:TIR domain